MASWISGDIGVLKKTRDSMDCYSHRVEVSIWWAMAKVREGTTFKRIGRMFSVFVMDRGRRREG